MGAATRRVRSKAGSTSGEQKVLGRWSARVAGTKEFVGALCPQAAEAIVKLRLQHPSLAISTLVRQLQESGVLQPGTFSLSSVYRLLVREGLDRPRLIAEGCGPTKALPWLSSIAA